MECPKCTEEIEPRLLNEWTQYGGYKFALYQCPKCETRFKQGKDNAVEFEKFVEEHKIVEARALKTHMRKRKNSALERT
jgi:hypothetical protein